MRKTIKGHCSYISDCQYERTYERPWVKMRSLGIRITFKYVHHV